jgi:hypothetical protein
MHRILLICTAVLFAALLQSQQVHAVEAKGLFISPAREYVNITAKKAKTGTFTVGNLNDAPMQITLSVEQFSLADYTYDYTFNPIKEDWIKFSKTQIDLAPKTSEKISYDILASHNASPGGHYFSIFATAQLDSGKQVRTALVLYTAVDGELKKTSEIISDNLPSLTIADKIPLHLDIKNTGNTHFFIYLSSTLSGWFSDKKGSETAHLLLPQTIRATEIAVPTPILPGIYKVSYGYRNEEGKAQTKEKYIMYIPTWSLLVLGGGIWLAIIVLRRRKHLKK